MVYDPSDHDTWSAGSFFTNPIVSAALAEKVRAVAAELRGADDAEDLTIGDLEADVVDGGQAAEATGDVGAGDGVHRDSWLMVSVEVDRLSGREGSVRPRISYDHTV